MSTKQQQLRQSACVWRRVVRGMWSSELASNVCCLLTTTHVVLIDRQWRRQAATDRSVDSRSLWCRMPDTEQHGLVKLWCLHHWNKTEIKQLICLTAVLAFRFGVLCQMCDGWNKVLFYFSFISIVRELLDSWSAGLDKYCRVAVDSGNQHSNNYLNAGCQNQRPRDNIIIGPDWKRETWKFK